MPVWRPEPARLPNNRFWRIALGHVLLAAIGHAELVLELKFDAETDSGVRFDPKVSQTHHILGWPTEVALIPRRACSSSNCAPEARDMRNSGITSGSGSA